MTRRIDGYLSDWDDDDQVGTYDHYCGDADGTEPILTFVCVGEDKDAATDERWAVFDTDEDGEGKGAVSRHPSREAAWEAAEKYLETRYHP